MLAFIVDAMRRMSRGILKLDDAKLRRPPGAHYRRISGDGFDDAPLKWLTTPMPLMEDVDGAQHGLSAVNRMRSYW